MIILLFLSVSLTPLPIASPKLPSESEKAASALNALKALKKDRHLETLKQTALRNPVQTKAIIIVHIYGMPFEMNKIKTIIKKKKIFLIEDCSQSHGAKYFKKRS